MKNARRRVPRGLQAASRFHDRESRRGIEVAVGGTDLKGFIRKAELARDRSDQRPERFAVGEKVDARVTTIDAKTRKVTLSVKALEVADEKKAMADYGSADSGASLGDILGEALRKKQEGAE